MNELLAIIELLLDAGLLLVVRAVPGVDNGSTGLAALPVCQFLARRHSAHPNYHPNNFSNEVSGKIAMRSISAG